MAPGNVGWCARRLVLAAALVAGACSHGPGSWKHVKTAHFDLYTTGGSGMYEPILERLEMVHLVLSTSFFQNTNVPGYDVFLYSAEDAMYLLGDYGGRFIGALGPRGTLLMKDGASSEYIDLLATHELAHGFIGATFRTLPVWFNEGFATYLESLRMRDGMACFGGRDRMQASEAYRAALIPVSELFAARSGSFHDGGWERSHYVSGWAVIHYLFHGENRSLRSRFDTFAAHFSDRTDLDQVSFRAWTETFPEIPLDRLDNRLKDHLRNVFDRPAGKCLAFKFKEPPTPDFQVTPADMAVVNARESWFKKNPMRLRM